MYATRWLEEEFHKALKTGMDAEGTQLETAAAWFAIVAMRKCRCAALDRYARASAVNTRKHGGILGIEST